MNNTNEPPFFERLDTIKTFHRYCFMSIRAGYLDSAIEKACKIRYYLERNLEDINELIENLHTKIENNEDNEPLLFDINEL